MIVAVDFDGTLCEENWPNIGEPNTNLLQYLLFIQTKGAKLILWTCRCGEKLTEAIEWCKGYGLIFDAVNENLPESVERFGSDSRKIYADLYIDDKSLTPFK